MLIFFGENNKADQVQPDIMMVEKRMDFTTPTNSQMKEPPISDTRNGRPKITAEKTGTKRDKTSEEKGEDEGKNKKSRGATMKKSQSQDDSDCSITGVHTNPLRIRQPLIFYLGFNWGSKNIDSFMLAYISRVHEVAEDGNCGYRALSVLAGQPESMYPSMRFDLSKCIQKNRPYWQMVIEEPRDISEFLIGINMIATPCPRQYWMRVPLMGLVFATMHQVAVVVLTWLGPCTCLPMYVPPGSEPPKTVVAIALVGKRDHFVAVTLVDDVCPIPPPPRQWMLYKDKSVDGWDTHPRFCNRFKAYLRERTAGGAPSIVN